MYNKVHSILQNTVYNVYCILQYTMYFIILYIIHNKLGYW